MCALLFADLSNGFPKITKQKKIGVGVKEVEGTAWTPQAPARGKQSRHGHYRRTE
jgi:hypothetical protein